MNVLLDIDDKQKCKYCGQRARYKTKRGKPCCSKYIQSCPTLKKKNRLGNINQSEESKRNRVEGRRKTGKPWFTEKARKNVIKACKNKERREKISKALKNIPKSEKHKKKISKAHKGMKKPWVIAACKKWYNSLSSKEKKEYYLKSRVKCNKKGQNKFEEDFDLLTPDIIKWVGDFQKKLIWENGKSKYPDFEVVGQNKLIELFGHGWHPKEDEQIYLNNYGKIGYSCFIVWYVDWYKNKKAILEQVNNFIGV